MAGVGGGCFGQAAAAAEVVGHVPYGELDLAGRLTCAGCGIGGRGRERGRGRMETAVTEITGGSAETMLGIWRGDYGRRD
jgi:hypothetical protein